MTPFSHKCEVCNKEEILTPEEAFEQGWDYPPKMGTFGIVSPRTCGDCGIESTVWWEITVNHTPVENLAPNHRRTLESIIQENQLQ